uniref:Uncharacterized protein n=1 Tax=Arundo donax TaxID=35708 RepID=A0A0A8Z5G2_ARUDO
MDSVLELLHSTTNEIDSNTDGSQVLALQRIDDVNEFVDLSQLRRSRQESPRIYNYWGIFIESRQRIIKSHMEPLLMPAFMGGFQGKIEVTIRSFPLC